MEEIIKNWKLNGEKDQEVNFLFIQSLKGKDSDKVDRVAKQLHEEAFSKISCLKCGHCCRTVKPAVLEEDIKRIATFLNLTKAELEEQYLEKNEFGDWQINSLPCPFFNENDNKCNIYSVRPKDCSGYPHTDKKGFVSRSHMHSENTIECPAVFHIVEEMKKRFR